MKGSSGEGGCGKPYPVVSVIIPTYNRQDFVPSAIASARAQTLPTFEIIVVDDGSTDDTPAVLHGLAGGEPRLRLVRQDNRGLSAARNAGLRRATAPWVAFLDDDDLWHPEFLSRMVAFVESQRVEAAACLAVQFSAPPAFADAQAVLASPERFAVAPCHPRRAGAGAFTVGELLLRPLAPPNAALLSADLIRHLGGFDEGLCSAEDYDLWLRLAHGRQVPVHEQVLALYRVHPSRLTSSLGRMARQTRIVLERFAAAHTEAVRLAGRRAFRRRPAVLYREEAYSAILSGERGPAMRAAGGALRHNPADWKAWAYLALAPWPGLYAALRRFIRSQ